MTTTTTTTTSPPPPSSTTAIFVITFTIAFCIRAIHQKHARKHSTATPTTTQKPTLLHFHNTFFSNSQTLAHGKANSLVIIRGEGAYLFDETNTPYLDSRNNVAILGHNPPDFVHAVASQLALTNTNTRYLHPSRMAFIQELSRTLPPTLCKFFLVNSGSEANDLALRLARTHTHRSRIVAMEMGYHGFTTATMAASPYKFRHRPEEGQMTSMVTLAFEPLSSVLAPINQDDDPAAALIIEPVLSVAGVIFPPPGWLKDAFQTIHHHGGLVICDEVQTGCGRLGDFFWGFEMAQGEVPDIVTMGKGIGNGISLGVVACTSEVASSMDNDGREVFSTFGGNPVACVAGLHVLTRLRETRAMENAKAMGEVLKHDLLALKKKCPDGVIIDVRGRGLFVGIEFANGEYASAISMRLVQKHHVLTSCDGKEAQVMVIKPPLCWTQVEVKKFVVAMTECVSHMVAVQASSSSSRL